MSLLPKSACRVTDKAAPSASRAGTKFPASRVDWAEVGPREHFVQFYESDAYLVDSVAKYFGSALSSGFSAVMIATADHCEGVKRTLEGNGFNLTETQAEGSFVILDARKTLDSFLVDGMPDADRFRATVGNVVARLTARGRRIHAFGEMVALLWEDGNRSAMIRLEELWNSLARELEFALFCAYPLDKFGKKDDGMPLDAICGCHQRVIPGESYARLAQQEDRAAAITQLQHKARVLEAEIARRTEAERMLIQRERDLSDFLENAVEPLHQVDHEGRIIWANRAELELLGYSRDEYVGQPIQNFHADQDVIASLLTRLLRGENVRDAAARLRCKDRSVRHVLISSNACFENGRFARSRCITKDVTGQVEIGRQQRALMEAQKKALADAERLSRMKDEFLAMLSHELRTPLNAIFGWTQIIKQDPTNLENIAEAIPVIDRNVRAQAKLVEELLDMSRIIAGHVELQLQPIDLAATVRAAVEAARPIALANRITLRFDEPCEEFGMWGDPARLQQVFSNLLSNALRFTPANGLVTATLALRGDRFEVAVRDTGEGIDAEFLPLIFDRFRQADTSIARKHGGLGLGLSIVKELVALHGGTVKAESPGLGRGATFVVCLPKPAQSIPAPKPADSCQETVPSLRGARVLVVEDDTDSRDLIGKLLREKLADVETVGSARAALDRLERSWPAVLICDIAMPEQDGYALLEEIKRRFGDKGTRLPSIALTAFARSEDRSKARSAGFHLHLAKPVEPAELVNSVAGLLRLSGERPADSGCSLLS